MFIIQRDEEAKKQEDMEAEQEENEAEEGDMEDIEERQQHRSTSKAKDQHRSSSLEQVGWCNLRKKQQAGTRILFQRIKFSMRLKKKFVIFALTNRN